MQHVFSAQPMEKLLLPRSVHGEEFQVRVSFITFHSTHNTDILLEEDVDLQISVCTGEAALPGES